MSPIFDFQSADSKMVVQNIVHYGYIETLK